MSANFLKLPGELRNRVYELCLLHQEHIHPWIGYTRQEITYGLLRANKAIHREASSVLYGQNCFNFTMATPEDLASFLETIGRKNTDCIRHVYIDFPEFHYLDPEHVILEEGSLAILANIRSGCANLSTLTTSLYSTNAMELRLDALDFPKIISEALELVNTRFQTISSLQEIIVEVYENGPSDYIRRKMESYGWKISVESDIEDDWDDDYSRDPRDDYGTDNDDLEDVDYDIDDDSDFWRRAAD
ncbi:hypothetical protein B7494_g3443 [Chlorociboria aeruginascens]|nr:hypothetical protein B7494_g3443 [Chlorociboria aeruginascens]